MSEIGVWNNSVKFYYIFYRDDWVKTKKKIEMSSQSLPPQCILAECFKYIKNSLWDFALS